MPRGGRREGAGRKSSLDPIQELWIGSQCERRFRAFERAALQDAREELFAKSHYREQVAIFRAVPPGRRKHWLRSEAGHDCLDDLKAARREMAGLGPDDPACPDPDGYEDFEEPDGPRLFQIIAKRPYGVKEAILAEIAALSSERYGKGISPRQVEKCWKLFRSVDAEEPNETS